MEKNIMEIDKQKQGKKNRADGAKFERIVRADLEKKGWIVAKWTNNVSDNKCIPASDKVELSSLKTNTLLPNTLIFPLFRIY